MVVKESNSWPIKVNLEFNFGVFHFWVWTKGVDTNIYSGFKTEIHIIFQFHF